LMSGHYGYDASGEVMDSVYIPATEKQMPYGFIVATDLKNIRKWLPISWDALKPDILHVLLHHSDCDGIIEHKHCKSLADRLEELLPLLPDGDGGGHIGDWREKTQRFIDGLRLADSLGENVEFH
jgi:hypothetical protein